MQKLTRHIKMVHRMKESAKTAMGLSKNKRDKTFAIMRWNGIIEYNKKQAALKNPVYQSEKMGKNK